MSGLRHKWRRGRTAFMAASMLPVSLITEILARAGFDA
jgi:hypothetical protein